MNDKVKKFHDALDDFLDRPIAFNPAFKRITASTVAGIFLSQAWYWSKRHKEDDGWFFKTGSEWEEETGLTRSEQETARKHCLRVGVIEEDLKGVPATMYYRVIKTRVYELLGIQFAGTPQTSSGGIPKFAGNQQSDNHSNINRNTETPPMIPNNEDGALRKNVDQLKTLYEQNIGAVTPLLMNLFRNAALTYSADWFRPAFEITVKSAKHRSWAFVESVLQSWKDHGYGWKPGNEKPVRSNGSTKDYSKPPEDDNFMAELEAKKARLRAEKAARMAA